MIGFPAALTWLSSKIPWKLILAVTVVIGMVVAILVTAQMIERLQTRVAGAEAQLASEKLARAVTQASLDNLKSSIELSAAEMRKLEARMDEWNIRWSKLATEVDHISENPNEAVPDLNRLNADANRMLEHASAPGRGGN